jgi:predicted small lipoprotein YifL
LRSSERHSDSRLLEQYPADGVVQGLTAARIHPGIVRPAKVISTTFRGDPNLLRRRMAVDDDLAFAGVKAGNFEHTLIQLDIVSSIRRVDHFDKPFEQRVNAFIELGGREHLLLSDQQKIRVKFMRNRRFIVLVLAIGLTGFGLSACGQKGPLVPPKAQTVELYNNAPAASGSVAAASIARSLNRTLFLH